VSVQGYAIGVWDTRYQTLVALDVELLRIAVLGAKALRVIDATIRIPANTNTGEATVYQGDTQLVVKKMEFTVPSGVTIASITLDIDGNVATIPFVNPLDFEAVFGAKVYGTVIRVRLEATANVTADTDIAVKIYGFDAGKTQIPSVV
jgi:hypothetical protein